MNAEVGKYLIVLGHYGQMGGAERQAFHFIRYLRDERDARVAALGWFGTEGPLADTLREWGCEVFSFPYKEITPRVDKIANLLRLAWFIRRQVQPDVILPFVAIHSKPICQVWRMTGARYAWWNQQDEGRGLFGTAAERKALRKAVHITSNSWAGTQFLAQTYGIPENAIHTYNNGTPLPKLERMQPQWRERLGIAVNTPLVSMVANVTRRKDHETLLRAWRRVQDEFCPASSAQPLLALAGHMLDTEHVNRLKVLAFDLGLGNSLRFLGAIDSTDALMWESDLVVHSSVLEGCPNAVCEAMALAKPVVATDIPGTRQALDNSLWHECLSAARDADDLAVRILELLRNKPLASRLGELNRQRIEREFTISRMCEFFMSLLERRSLQ